MVLHFVTLTAPMGFVLAQVRSVENETDGRGRGPCEKKDWDEGELGFHWPLGMAMVAWERQGRRRCPTPIQVRRTRKKAPIPRYPPRPRPSGTFGTMIGGGIRIAYLAAHEGRHCLMTRLDVGSRVERRVGVLLLVGLCLDLRRIPAVLDEQILFLADYERM